MISYSQKSYSTSYLRWAYLVCFGPCICLIVWQCDRLVFVIGGLCECSFLACFVCRWCCARRLSGMVALTGRRRTFWLRLSSGRRGSSCFGCMSFACCRQRVAFSIDSHWRYGYGDLHFESRACWFCSCRNFEGCWQCRAHHCNHHIPTICGICKNYLCPRAGWYGSDFGGNFSCSNSVCSLFENTSAAGDSPASLAGNWSSKTISCRLGSSSDPASCWKWSGRLRWWNLFAGFAGLCRTASELSGAIWLGQLWAWPCSCSSKNFGWCPPGRRCFWKCWTRWTIASAWRTWCPIEALARPRASSEPSRYGQSTARLSGCSALCLVCSIDFSGFWYHYSTE